MRFYTKEIKVNRLQTVIVECRRYRKTNKWSVRVGGIAGVVGRDDPLYHCCGLRLNKDEVRKMVNNAISAAIAHGSYYPE